MLKDTHAHLGRVFGNLHTDYLAIIDYKTAGSPSRKLVLVSMSVDYSSWLVTTGTISKFYGEEDVDDMLVNILEHLNYPDKFLVTSQSEFTGIVPYTTQQMLRHLCSYLPVNFKP
jgi:hypothetical protein